MLRSYGIKKNGIRDFGLVGFSFSIPIQGVLYDIDRNIYHWITIGTQQWLVENLKTIHYSDGTLIPYLTSDAEIFAENGTLGHDGGYCWYNDDILNKNEYGGLYNWYAVENIRILAPVGWRIPTETDINTLIAFIGGTSVGGGKLKEIGLTHWNSPNTSAIDLFGFKALGAGERVVYLGHWALKTIGSFFISGEYIKDIGLPGDPQLYPLLTEVLHDSSFIDITATNKIDLYSVRCVRDVA